MTEKAKACVQDPGLLFGKSVEFCCVGRDTKKIKRVRKVPYSSAGFRPGLFAGFVRNIFVHTFAWSACRRGQRPWRSCSCRSLLWACPTERGGVTERRKQKRMSAEPATHGTFTVEMRARASATSRGGWKACTRLMPAGPIGSAVERATFALPSPATMAAGPSGASSGTTKWSTMSARCPRRSWRRAT